jgi:hypothetical protein
MYGRGRRRPPRESFKKWREAFIVLLVAELNKLCFVCRVVGIGRQSLESLQDQTNKGAQDVFS